MLPRQSLDCLESFYTIRTVSRLSRQIPNRPDSFDSKFECISHFSRFAILPSTEGEGADGRPGQFFNMDHHKTKYRFYNTFINLRNQCKYDMFPNIWLHVIGKFCQKIITSLIKIGTTNWTESFCNSGLLDLSDKGVI